MEGGKEEVRPRLISVFLLLHGTGAAPGATICRFTMGVRRGDLSAQLTQPGTPRTPHTDGHTHTHTHTHTYTRWPHSLLRETEGANMPHGLKPTFFQGNIGD